MEQGENICNTILVDVNYHVTKISNLPCGHHAFVALDFDRQLSWANILDMFEIGKKVNRQLAINQDKIRIDRAAVIQNLPLCQYDHT